MNSHDLKTSLPFPKYFWTAKQTTPGFPVLKENHTTEIGIVGGGIVGIISAYLLAKAGKKVTLIESGRQINGVTDHTTHLHVYLEVRPTHPKHHRPRRNRKKERGVRCS